MRILFVTPYIPSRIRVRPFHILQELSSRHEVSVVALAQGGSGEAPGTEDLRRRVKELRIVPHSAMRGALQSIGALATASPMCTAFCRSWSMQAIVDGMLSRENFDVVHVEHLRAAHFAPLGGRIPVVIDSVDCLTGLFGQMSRSGSLVKRVVMAEEAWKLKRYEPRALRRFDRVAVTAEAERDELLSMDGGLNVEVIPNGVDAEYFAPMGNMRVSTRIVFTGKMSYAANATAVTWFAENVLPGLLEECPSVEFVIAGSNPPAEVKALSRLPGVTVTGYVPDVRGDMDSASIAVAPMQIAVGIQNKVLEAMAMALPVVATPIAARSFGDGCKGIVEAGTAGDMIEAILRLIDNPREACELGRLGRQEVEARFCWRAAVEKFEGMYEDAVGLKAGRQYVGDAGR